MVEKEEIIINKIAQNKISIDLGIEWFESLTDSEKIRIVNRTKYYLEQSHPNAELIEKAISNIPLKPTMTPVVILKTNDFKIALNKIIELPKSELSKVFITLITIFKISDTFRRENFCKDECTHEWHNLDKKTTYNTS